MQETLLDEEARAKLESLGDISYARGAAEKLPEEARRLLPGSTACITSWGSPRLDAALLDSADTLELMAYGAGSVKPVVSDEMWARGIKVTSSAAANGIDVAYTSLALMVLGWKNVFRLSKEMAEARTLRPEGLKARELYHSVVGIIGAGHIGRWVIELLKGIEPYILLYDPYVSEQEARQMGVTKCAALSELVEASDVISVHAPSLPQTKHMLNRQILSLMKPRAVLVNTARGALIDEAALVEVMQGTERFACLDVTDPEPPALESPLRKLPNVLLTPHLAGSVHDGIARMGAYAVEEVRRYLAGEPLMNEVTPDMIGRIA